MILNFRNALATLIFLLTISPMVWGQQESRYLTVEKLTTKHTIDLDGKASLVVFSSHDDLVVTTNAPQDVVQKSIDAKGKFVYEVRVDISQQRDRLFTANRKVIKESFKETLEPDTRIYYTVEEVDIPITLVKETSLGNHHFVADEAALEFNTSIDNLQVSHGKDIECSIKRSNSSTGTHIVTVIIRIKPFIQLREKYVALGEEYEQINAKYLSEGTSLAPEVLDEMDKRMDELKKQMEELQETISDMSTFTVYGDKTNTLSVSIEDLGVKQKMSFSVLLLKEKVEVFESEYAQLLRSAEQAEENRKFKIAQQFYEQAISAEGIPEGAKAALANKIREMEDCQTHSTKATQSMAYIAKLKKENNEAKVQEVEDHFRNAKISYENLYRLRGSDTFYKNLIDKIDVQLEKMNFYVIEGSVRAKNGGARLHGVSIYAVYDTSMNKDIEKKASGVKIGNVDANGNFRVEVKRDAKYGGLLFVPENNKGVKQNGFLPMPQQHLKTTIYLNTK